MGNEVILQRTKPNGRVLATSVFALVIAFAASSASAGQSFTWNMSTPAGPVASPHVYPDISNTHNLIAYGFRTSQPSPFFPGTGTTWGPGGAFDFSTGTVSSNPLYGKVSTPGETGLGLDGLNPEHEIEAASFVQLDLNEVIQAGLVNVVMTIKSVGFLQGYYIWGSDTVGVPGTLMKQGFNPITGFSNQTFLIPQYGTYRYLGVSAAPIGFSSYAAAANNDDDHDHHHFTSKILIGELCATFPEPATLALLGLGGLLALRRRRA